MFAYCHNNPVLFFDPSGFIIVLSPDVTEEQEEEYERAIAYLKTSETGRKLIERLETSSVVFTIEFVDNDEMRYYYEINTIYFDINSGLVLSDDKSIQSAALGLAHEMGHAAQDLDGIYDDPSWNGVRREANNLEKYETPIALELGEPTRSNYNDGLYAIAMHNSTHFKNPRSTPWWRRSANWGSAYAICD